MKRGSIAGAITAVAATMAMAVSPASADKLDDILADGEVKCGIMLDVPPVGMRDENSNPIGFDVEFCKDMAEALGVEAIIVETPAPDRIPAILSGRVDVGVASATNTLERAKSVGFSIPYQIWSVGVAVRADNDQTHSGTSDRKPPQQGQPSAASRNVDQLSPSFPRGD